MRRWTTEELKEYSDVAFLNAILQDRKDVLISPYSPMSERISELQNKLKSGSRFDQNGMLIAGD